MHVQTLIVGQGIAGSTLALQLKKRGEDFMILDDQHLHASSLVAAGLYNPVVFRKPSLSFNTPKLIPYLKSFYQEWEHVLATQFHHNRRIIKLFTTVEEINNWDVKSRTPEFSDYLQKDLLPAQFNEHIHCPLGAGVAEHSGNVNLPVFLQTVRTYLNHNLINRRLVEYEKRGDQFIVTTPDGNMTCDRLILCTGHKKNETFKHLPLGDTKGDILTIYCPEIEGTDIINKGFFILPLGEGHHRVGATFDWDDKSYIPSKKARIDLKSKLDSVLKCSYSIEDQMTGLRPTVGDRRPLLGEHPETKNLYIFNGLGSKGVMLAPYYSEQLFHHIFDEHKLDPEVDIKRYFKHYGHS